MIPDIFIRLAVALGLGLLVGLQRERVDPVIAGIRWSDTISAIGWSRRRNSSSALSASAPEVARTMR